MVGYSKDTPEYIEVLIDGKKKAFLDIELDTGVRENSKICVIGTTNRLWVVTTTLATGVNNGPIIRVDVLARLSEDYEFKP